MGASFGTVRSYGYEWTPYIYTVNTSSDFLVPSLGGRREARRRSSGEARAVSLDDDPPEHAALAPIVVAVRPVHGGAVVDDEHVALAPGVVIHDLRPDHPLEKLLHVGAARLGRHAAHVGGLGDVEVHRARAVDGMRAHHGVLHGLPVLLAVLGARVGVAVEPVERGQRVQAPALLLGQGEIGGAHARHTGTAACRGNLHAVEGWWRRAAARDWCGRCATARRA